MRLLSALLILFSMHAARADDDPYGGVHFFELPNGLKVTLLPHPGASRVLVEVIAGVGHNEEAEHESGAAHVIEHALFRNDAGEASYFDRLSAEGADTNGLTLDDQTVFYASLPADRAEFLVKLFGRMFHRDAISAATLAAVKSEVALEYASPNREEDDRSGDMTGGLLESEFGLPHTHPSSGVLTETTRAMTTKGAEEFLRRHYHPRNLTLMVVGNFNESAARGWINQAFGDLSSGTRVARVEPLPHPKKHGTFKVAITPHVPRITIGTKFWGAEPQDELVAHAYLDGLANRLMRKLRTEQAVTYTVSPIFLMDTRKFGIALLSFESLAGRYGNTLDYVRTLIKDEARDKKISDTTLRETRELFFAKLRAQESDVKSLRDLATNYFVFRSTYGVVGTPYQLFRQISDAEFRDRLARLFAADRELGVLNTAPRWFANDDSWLAGLAMLVTYLLVRLAFRRRDNERGPFRFYARVTYTPSTYALILFRVVVALGVWGMACLPFLWWEIDAYLRAIYMGPTLVVAVLWALSQVPRRLLVIDNRLVLKSLTFASRSYPLAQVTGVTVCPVLVASRRLHWRSSLTHLSFFRPGVLIQMRDGSGYYLGFEDTSSVARELKALLPSTNKLPAIIVPPPIRIIAGGAR